MKKVKFLGLVIAFLFSAQALFSQSRIVIDQSSNAVAFSTDNKTWGLEVNGKKVLSPVFKTVGFQNGLFRIEKTDGTWNVCDKTGAMKLDWIPASGVKISDSFVLFENADGNKAISYDRSTWQVVQATEITYEQMYKEVEKANADKGTKIHGYESLAQENLRKYRTQPRVERKNGKDHLMFRDVQFIEADKVSLLTQDFNEEYWYFLVEKNGKMGIGYIDSEYPTDVNKASFSIGLKYSKIESASSKWRVFKCTLPNGTVEERWMNGKYTYEVKIPD
jgi:hypothetical protein